MTKRKPDPTDPEDLWLPTGQAARCLARSGYTLKRYADVYDFLEEGKHWCRGPFFNSPRIWNVTKCREALTYRGRISK